MRTASTLTDDRDGHLLGGMLLSLGGAGALAALVLAEGHGLPLAILAYSLGASLLLLGVVATRPVLAALQRRAARFLAVPRAVA